MPKYQDIPQRTFKLPASPTQADYEKVATEFLDYADSLFDANDQLSNQTRTSLFVTTAYAYAILGHWQDVATSLRGAMKWTPKGFHPYKVNLDMMIFAHLKTAPVSNYYDAYLATFNELTKGFNDDYLDQLRKYSQFLFTDFQKICANAFENVRKANGKAFNVEQSALGNLMGGYVFGQLKGLLIESKATAINKNTPIPGI